MRSLIVVLATCFLATALQHKKSLFSAGRRATAQLDARHTEHAAMFAKLGIHLVPGEAIPPQIIFKNQLGSGSYGVVYQAEWERKMWFNKKIAVKLVKQTATQTEEQLIESVIAEGSMVQLVSHCEYVMKCDTAFKCKKKDLPNDVQAAFADVADTGLILGLVTNFAAAGELKDNFSYLSGKQRYKLMQQYATELGCISATD